jgi:hypothetical protein
LLNEGGPHGHILRCILWASTDDHLDRITGLPGRECMSGVGDSAYRPTIDGENAIATPQACPSGW